LPDPTAAIVRFLTHIGIPVRAAAFAGVETVLPGIRVVDGTLEYDPARLRFPGDLLHEAGHLAIQPSALRASMQGRFEADGGEEMAAIAWSYAAALAAGLDPAVVFHAQGYRGGAAALLENFEAGHYVGVWSLARLGMTHEPRAAAANGQAAYPVMRRWRNDSPDERDARSS
jgi:hypothetical protein